MWLQENPAAPVQVPPGKAPGCSSALGCSIQYEFPLRFDWVISLSLFLDKVKSYFDRWGGFFLVLELNHFSLSDFQVEHQYSHIFTVTVRKATNVTKGAIGDMREYFSFYFACLP